jgi:hypothetical protein
MEIFGFVCSGYCKGKAENQGIVVPSFSGTRAKAEAKRWRRTGMVIAAVVIAFAVFLGAWGWYAWIGSVPKVAFALRFPASGYSGQVRFHGQNQAIFLHGGRLVRHDTKSKTQVWENLLIDKKKIADEAAEMHKQMVESRRKGIEAGVEYSGSLPTLAELIDSMEQSVAATMHLHLRGENVWVSSPDKLTRFDWQTGTSTQEIPLPPGEKRLLENGDELLVELVRQGVKRVNLVSGDARNEGLSGENPGSSTSRVASNVSASSAPAGNLSDATRTQNLSTPARAVLPAIRAASANQQRLTGEMAGPSGTSPRAAAISGFFDPRDQRVVVSRNGTFQLSAKPIGNKVVDGDSVTMHRVIFRRLGPEPGAEWTGDLPGSPELHPLKTVDVLAGGKSFMVLDKAGQKRWEAKLNLAVPAPPLPEFRPENSSAGNGPCVEQGDTLYIYDPGALTSFDLGTGALRWTLATAESTGLFIDDQGMIYVNGITSGGEKAQPMVTKVDSKTGRQLWRVEREGAVSHVQGTLVYTVESYIGDNDEADGILGASTIFHVPAYLRIRRLDTKSGRILWHHHQPRCPLDVQFDKTTIQVLFKKELQTLTFLLL